MAKVFLDVNVLIDLLEKRREITPKHFANHEVVISPLSIHITFYVLKKKVPFKKLELVLKQFSFSGLTEKISSSALRGPTTDFEDNVQLHSASEAACNVFITSDEKVLRIKSFGKTQIITPESLK